MYFLCKVIFLHNHNTIITPSEINIDKIISNMQSILRFPQCPKKCPLQIYFLNEVSHFTFDCNDSLVSFRLKINPLPLSPNNFCQCLSSCCHILGNKVDRLNLFSYGQSQVRHFFGKKSEQIGSELLMLEKLGMKNKEQLFSSLFLQDSEHKQFAL